MLVAGWHTDAANANLDLATSVAELLTVSTTGSLPSAWRGEYSIARARQWIADRDRESPTLLAIDRRTGNPVGLVIVFESPSDDGPGIDLRVGYLLSESVWGQGLATELVAGLVAWARKRPSISTLTGGVEATNPASSRVLLKNGFTQVGSSEEGRLVFRLRFDGANPSDENAA
ncbi:MAG: GNAT family N-acetyltransferase [Miltoncostaeaceae bacterium]